MRGIQRSEQSSLLGFNTHDHATSPLPSLDYPDEILTASIRESLASLKYAFDRGLDRWAIMYSGGKDSTALVILALEAVRRELVSPRTVDIVYSDTGVEIPPMLDVAQRFLRHVEDLAKRENLPVSIHRIHPDADHSYWVYLLGRGYPPPHQRFRWCTARLKVRPSKKLLERLGPAKPSVVITGVRFGESKTRDASLRAQCERGGECGQGVWFQEAPQGGRSFVAPLVNWATCEVWDFLNFAAPSLGWDTSALREIYGEDETRFGCWTCTVVRQDKTMAKLVAQERWKHLKPLADLRNEIWAMTRPADGTRVTRPDGAPGKLSLQTRRRLLERVRHAERESGLAVLSEEETDIIEELHSKEG